MVSSEKPGAAGEAAVGRREVAEGEGTKAGEVAVSRKAVVGEPAKDLVARLAPLACGDVAGTREGLGDRVGLLLGAGEGLGERGIISL